MSFEVEKRNTTFPSMAKRIQETENKAEDILAEQDRDLMAVFGTPQGMRVLDVLEAQYAGRLLDKDPNITQANAARREIFDRIREALKLIEENEQ